MIVKKKNRRIIVFPYQCKAKPFFNHDYMLIQVSLYTYLSTKVLYISLLVIIISFVIYNFLIIKISYTKFSNSACIA